MMDQNVLATIKQTVTENPIVLYMKGTPQAPQCGFSGRTVQILQACGVHNFVAVDVYADQGVYENLQYYANWPTFPQLYVKGELVGGADIVRDMHQQGELQKLLHSATG
jgi:monothiol glutaredoxin